MEAELIKFLIEAKKQSYANASAKKVKSSRLASHDYEYSNGKLTYHDTYFGGIKFMGEEVVYDNNSTPLWGMNYYGITLDETLSEKIIDKALRPALMQVGEDNILPVRGPKLYINEDYKYTFKVTGSVDNFEGTEEIYINDKKVYVLRCHGGKIK